MTTGVMHGERRIVSNAGTQINRTDTFHPSSARWASFGRICGALFGVGTQLLFLYTVVYLFLFLRYGSVTPRTDHYWWLEDFALALGFAIPHSILLAPPIQKRLKSYLPAGLLGCVHCVTTCVTLLVLFRCWGVSSFVIWRMTGATETIMLGLFYASWVALFYSLYLTGLGYQTGLTQWWYWLTNTKPPKREFVIRGAFRWMRHPVYMSFLGLIWFTPTMTLDHAILTSIWTAYIFAGSYFKDRRLIRFIGPDYIEYGKRVVGLPLIGIGSLRYLR